MKASKESVIRGAKEYIQLEIAQRMTGLNAFAINFLLPSLEKKFSMLYDKYAKDELFSDLFDENCFVDLDALVGTSISNSLDRRLLLAKRTSRTSIFV